MIIDVPSYITEFTLTPHYLVQEKVFDFIDEYGSHKYLKDYKILYNGHSKGKHYIEKMIHDWDLEFKEFKSEKENPTGRDKYKAMQDMLVEGKNGEALVFFSYPHKDSDVGNNILIGQLNYHRIFTKVCRFDFNNKFI